MNVRGGAYSVQGGLSVSAAAKISKGRVIMFIRSVKLKKPRLLLAVVVLALCGAVAVLVVLSARRSPVVYNMRTEEERQEFLASMGWEVSEKYTECRSVTVPEEFSEVYESYNALQKQQGFDLERYKGRTVEVYTYEVYNYEGHEDKGCMICTLMVCDGVLIGGDVCCTELGGFMTGLKKG